MGAGCSKSFVGLDLSTGDDILLQQLRYRPPLLSTPVPAAVLGMHETAIHLAAEKNNFRAVQVMFDFLSAADLPTLREALRPLCRRLRLPPPSSSAEGLRLAANATNSKGQTPLMYACFHHCPEVASFLLQKGADPWVADRCGCRNALHYAAMSGSAACAEAIMAHTPPHLLLRGGVRYVNSRSLAGLTALHYAIFYEHGAAVMEVLRHDPNINAPTTAHSYDLWSTAETLSTPLHFAALKNDAAAARLLLLHYARRRRTGTVLDPRMRMDSAAQLPWQVSRSRALASMIHPAQSLAEALGPDGAAALAEAEAAGGDADGQGPPPLAAIAAAALRQKLLSSVEIIEREGVEAASAAARAAQASRRCGLIPLLCGATGAPTAPGRSTMPRMGSTNSRAWSLTRAAGAAAAAAAAANSSFDGPASPRRAPTLSGAPPHPPELPYGGSNYAESVYDAAPDVTAGGSPLPPGSHFGGRASTGRPVGGGGGGGLLTHTRSGRLRSGKTVSGRPAAMTRAASARHGGGAASGVNSGGGGGGGSHSGGGGGGGGRVPVAASNVTGGSPNSSIYRTSAVLGDSPTNHIGGNGGAGTFGYFSYQAAHTAGSQNLGGCGLTPAASAQLQLSRTPSYSIHPPQLPALPALGTAAYAAANGGLQAAAVAGIRTSTGGTITTAAADNVGPLPHANHANVPPGKPLGTGLVRTSPSPFSTHGINYQPPNSLGGSSPPPPSRSPPLPTPLNGTSPTLLSAYGHLSGTLPGTALDTCSGGGSGRGGGSGGGGGGGRAGGGDGNRTSTGGAGGARASGEFDAIAGGSDGGGGLAASMYDGNVVYDEGYEYADDDVDEGLCAVCFARREAVAAASCRHGLCTACAAELCRAVTNKPLLCPFCRQPVTDFVRVVVQPPPQHR